MSRNQSHGRRSFGFRTWFEPGMGVKRWLVLLAFGVSLCGLGFGYLLRELYTSVTFPEPVYYLTLQFIPRVARGIIFMGLAGGSIALAIWKLNRYLLSVVMDKNGDDRPLVEMVYNHRNGQRGPKVVAIGGGTGLSVLLRGMKEYTSNLTAIVTVADDGGSSGRLRRDLGVLPPGDFRNCIAALADAEPLVTRLMQYRFGEGGDLEGHSFGNLFIVAMAGVTGNFEEAIRETSRVLRVRGQILPSTLEDVTLNAELDDARLIRGESLIGVSDHPIGRVYLDPPHPAAYPGAMQAIQEADLIIMGPGSVFTSVLPNLLVEGITKSIMKSKATKVYICNVATQPGETDGFDAENHAEALLRHTNDGLFNYFLVHDSLIRPVPSDGDARPVLSTGRSLPGISTIVRDVVSDETPLRHDPYKLSEALIDVLNNHRRS